MADDVGCWADLTLTEDEVERAVAFYGAVLGWTVTGDGAADHHVVVALDGGRPVAGIGGPDGSPPGWTLYFGVADVAESATAAEEAGATVLQGPDDDGRGGLLVVALDVGGAAFGFWESDDWSPVAGDDGGPVVWVEAASAEPGQTTAFYGAVLGFGHRTTAEPGTSTLHRDGGDGSRPLGAVTFAGDALPHWLVHFAVPDVDAAADAARVAGGTVVEGPDEHPRGRRAVLTDPNGARFAVLEGS